MKSRQFLLVLMALIFSMALSGCGAIMGGGLKINKDQFGPSKKYALIYISSDKTIAYKESLLDKKDDPEREKAENTQPIIDKLMPKIRAKLAKTGYFRSLPMKTIVNSKSYKSMKEDSKIRDLGIYGTRVHNVAKGYKYFREDEKEKRIARDLNVDGLITIHLQFEAGNLAPTSSTAKVTFTSNRKYSVVTASIYARDRDTNSVWRDFEVKINQSVVITSTSGKNLYALHPTSLKAAEEAIDVLIRRFQNAMEGK